MDIDIIMIVLVKILSAQCLKIRENNHKSRCLCKPCGNCLLSSLSLSMKSIKEEIQSFDDCVDTQEVGHLNNFENSFK